MITKKCYKCTEVKNATEFLKNVTKPDGLEIQCKACAKKIKRTQSPSQGRSKGYDVIPSAFKVNKRKHVIAYSAKANRISQGKEKDDYTNHFYSHFGWYDVAHDIERDNNIHYMPEQKINN